MMDDRNLTVHTYNEKTAHKIYQNLKDYLPLFEQLRQSLASQLGPS